VIRLGTSGFKFDDWKGHFYPPGVAEKDWLAFYAQRFSCLEVNSTYYRILNAAIFRSMARKVPRGFLFTVKAHRTMTHEVGPGTAEDFKTFIGSVEPLLEEKKFGCLLAQFPTRFQNVPENRSYLLDFKERCAGLPLVVEFRSRDWLQPETFNFLRENELSFCCVDEPQFRSLMPPVAEATSSISYVRFHGRNYENWWSGDVKRRYDYLYSLDELKEWAPKIRRLDDMSSECFVFMNNCYQAKAATNALQFADLLADRLVPWSPPRDLFSQ
jgi:uncharacterized protein YecE (DUF72 family)